MKMIHYKYSLDVFTENDPDTGIPRTVTPSYTTIVNGNTYTFNASANPLEVSDEDAVVILQNQVFEDVTPQ